MKIISFAWTTPALLAGRKTVTRRDWSPEYARRFSTGELVQAYDRSPRLKGKCVATIRIVSVTWEPDSDAPDTDYEAEGFACKVYGITRRQKRAMTARQVAALMGCVDVNRMAVQRWIADGRLKAVRGIRQGKYRQWKIDEGDLIEFLEDPEHWHCWVPDFIPDPALRDWAMELRGDVRFITAKEAAALLGVSYTVIRYRSEVMGLFRLYRDRKLTFVRLDEIEHLSRGAMPRGFIARGLRAVRELERSGATWEEIPAPEPFKRVRVLRKAA